jgi:hypothetical protein
MHHGNVQAGLEPGAGQAHPEVFVLYRSRFGHDFVRLTGTPVRLVRLDVDEDLAGAVVQLLRRDTRLSSLAMCRSASEVPFGSVLAAFSAFQQPVSGLESG